MPMLYITAYYLVMYMANAVTTSQPFIYPSREQCEQAGKIWNANGPYSSGYVCVPTGHN
jgi:hypothetical protein